MARTRQTARGGGRAPRKQLNNASRYGGARHYDEEYMKAQKKAERHERIVADQLRVDAKWRPKIPAVRKVNWEDFKNHFQDVDQPEYAIEVLVGNTNLQSQIRQEQGLRRKEDFARMRESWMKEWGASKPEGPQNSSSAQDRARRDDRARKEKRADVAQLPGGQIQRVRVQSQPVLGHLTALFNETYKRSSPRTFLRPFRSLVYFQPKMKAILASLEEKWGDVEDLDDVSGRGVDTFDDVDVVEKPGSSTTSGENSDGAQKNEEGEDFPDDISLASVDSNAEDIDLFMDSTEALRDMRCYVNFVDEEIMPLYQQFDGNSATTVKYDDLWALYRVGDLIYFPSAGETGGRYHEVWRIYRVESPDADISYPKAGGEFYADDFGESRNEGFKIYAYYIDHDGTAFGAVRHKFEIENFPGERAIDSLEVFPIRFWDDRQNALDTLKSQGRSFQAYLEASNRHQSYSAWTLTRNPPFDTEEVEDEILRDENNAEMRHPEFVESDVIVDMMEAYHKNPDWRPRFHTPALTKPILCDAEEDEMPIQQWYEGARGKLAYTVSELVQTKDGVETYQRREGLNVDRFLRQRVRGTRRYEKDPSALELREEDLILLPKRMFAYVLRERRFVPVNINFLQPIRRDQGVFESLSIQKDYKDIVRGLVVSHFQKKGLERRYAEVPVEGTGQDLIQGKGRGLVVLLHGVPGVGKTATAEAVAMENRKPLFVITCGDLGLSPSQVESSLTNVFRLANLWDCVLLLDEADVFLTQRSNDDMNRNALVSVFLRVLEYYNGLLFLTTNRVGSIDDAFKSRIHMSLYYPPLDKTQTRDIFRLNIAKLRAIEAQRCAMTGDEPLIIKEDDVLAFAAKHYENNARLTACWNGRQIRNAFQVASSLANYKFADDVKAAHALGRAPPAAPVLDGSLFEKVQMSTVSFDRHMQDGRGIDTDLPLRTTFDRKH
ncbi:hypothetical protein G7054_g735 [Neopestalotiopsis clavispora]|nr:hypothetical protein G7054_g735 [Neopestalotiopsis clavispora]